VFIYFEAELRSEIDALNAEWRHSRREGLEGVLPLYAEVWGPSRGTMLGRLYPPDFVAYLKRKSFPFEH
jgi:hypothetical protein